jgi:hypothetical protein
MEQGDLIKEKRRVLATTNDDDLETDCKTAKDGTARSLVNLSRKTKRNKICEYVGLTRFHLFINCMIKLLVWRTENET